MRKECSWDFNELSYDTEEQVSISEERVSIAEKLSQRGWDLQRQLQCHSKRFASGQEHQHWRKKHKKLHTQKIYWTQPLNRCIYPMFAHAALSWGSQWCNLDDYVGLLRLPISWQRVNRTRNCGKESMKESGSEWHVLDEVVDDDGVRGGQEALKTVWNLSKLHSRHLKNLLKVLVVVDVLSLLRILQPIGLRQKEKMSRDFSHALRRLWKSLEQNTHKC